MHSLAVDIREDNIFRLGVQSLVVQLSLQSHTLLLQDIRGTTRSSRDMGPLGMRMRPSHSRRSRWRTKVGRIGSDELDRRLLCLRSLHGSRRSSPECSWAKLGICAWSLRSTGLRNSTLHTGSWSKRFPSSPSWLRLFGGRSDSRLGESRSHLSFPVGLLFCALDHQSLSHMSLLKYTDLLHSLFLALLVLRHMLVPLCPLPLDIGLHLLSLFSLMQSFRLVVCCLLSDSFQTSCLCLFTEIELSVRGCVLLLDRQHM